MNLLIYDERQHFYKTLVNHLVDSADAGPDNPRVCVVLKAVDYKICLSSFFHSGWLFPDSSFSFHNSIVTKYLPTEWLENKKDPYIFKPKAQRPKTPLLKITHM